MYRPSQYATPVWTGPAPPEDPLTTPRTAKHWLLRPRATNDPFDFSKPMFVRAEATEDEQGAHWYVYEPSGAAPEHVGPYRSSARGSDAAAIAREYGDYEVVAATNLPGEYHPRIWRNGWSATQRCPRRWEHREYPPDLAHARRAAAVSAHRILNMLADTFDHVEPSLLNEAAFGPALRHLLILACTEVEAAWRGVLAANTYSRLEADPHVFLSTRDYVKLREPMRLHEYQYRLALYHDVWTDPIAPFVAWTHENPTLSLPWYDAYNAAKHDRETARARANVRMVIDAVASVVIMLEAQFGTDAPEVRSVLEHAAGFEPTAKPTWPADELYFPADEYGFRRKPLPLLR